MSTYDFLSEELIDSSIDLNEQFGVNEIAWSHKDCSKVLDYCKDNMIGILGGDIYKITSLEDIEQTYINWSCDPQPGESKEQYVYRSIEKSANEIQKNQTVDFIFVFVFADKIL